MLTGGVVLKMDCKPRNRQAVESNAQKCAKPAFRSVDFAINYYIQSWNALKMITMHF